MAKIVLTKDTGAPDPAALDHGDELHRSIKVVAVVGYGNGDWAAYWGPAEWADERVAARGDKMPEEAALAFFPIFRGLNRVGHEFTYRP